MSFDAISQLEVDFVLSGNFFKLILRRIQLFSQRCENIINQIKESYLAFENCKIEFYTRNYPWLGGGANLLGFHKEVWKYD